MLGGDILARVAPRFARKRSYTWQRFAVRCPHQKIRDRAKHEIVEGPMIGATGDRIVQIE